MVYLYAFLNFTDLEKNLGYNYLQFLDERKTFLFFLITMKRMGSKYLAYTSNSQKVLFCLGIYLLEKRFF